MHDLFTEVQQYWWAMWLLTVIDAVITMKLIEFLPVIGLVSSNVSRKLVRF